MKESDPNKLWLEIRANSEKLKACSHHEFERDMSDGALAKYRCKNCGGTAQVGYVNGYKKGINERRKG